MAPLQLTAGCGSTGNPMADEQLGVSYIIYVIYSNVNRDSRIYLKKNSGLDLMRHLTATANLPKLMNGNGDP
jgi:hypothetical protein